MHPTVKPVAMVADAIMDCTARGEVVLDAFAGSGTTLIAAERVGRILFGCEYLFTTSLTRSAVSRYLGLFFHDFEHTFHVSAQALVAFERVTILRR
jgi:DNA modification methylase